MPNAHVLIIIHFFGYRLFYFFRYAKYNLFDEVNVDRPDSPEYSFFTSDFGVRFSSFVCFDILFADPPLRLIHEYNVTNFIFTTHWFSELPFLTGEK